MIILCAEKMPKQKVSLVLPSPCGRAKSLEEALNVLLCLGRGAISIATRGQEWLQLTNSRDTACRVRKQSLNKNHADTACRVPTKQTTHEPRK